MIEIPCNALSLNFGTHCVGVMCAFDDDPLPAGVIQIFYHDEEREPKEVSFPITVSEFCDDEIEFFYMNPPEFLLILECAMDGRPVKLDS